MGSRYHFGAEPAEITQNMASLIDRALARIAFVHARGVYRRFLATLSRVEDVQATVLAHTLAGMAGSEFSRQHRLERIRTVDELRRAVPIRSYEDIRPFIDRVRDGHTTALLAASQRPLMFATSSGTTAQPKYIPVTPGFVRQYRRGWNTFGLKMLADHPEAILRAILQSSGRFDESYTSAGIPCGAITGLLARTQKRIVRRYYVGVPEIAYIDDPRGRYYALARFGVVRDVAFAVTANPATLIRIAQTADEESETLIRDVRAGGLSARIVCDPRLRAALSRCLRPDPRRAAELEQIRAATGRLRPRDYWSLAFLACWTGGSMGYYLQRLADWYGPIPVRDVGLLASEGRVSLPLDDGTPAGVLDILGAVFEFIPAEDAERPDPLTLLPHEVETGRDYIVVLTNSAGLVRYRLDDVVRIRGRIGRTPLLEFLHRAGRVSSVAGEKLTENQLVSAIQIACQKHGIPEFDFVAGPVWDDPPYYRLSATVHLDSAAVAAIDRELAKQNNEYELRRKSMRINSLTFRFVPPDRLASMDQRLIATRSSTSEQYKRPCLFTVVGGDDDALGLTET